MFWRPPPDLAAGEHLAFIATVNDLRGHRAATEVRGVTVADGGPAFGIRGAKTPLITTSPASAMNAKAGEAISLFVRAEGTGPLEFQWLRDGAEIPGATEDTLRLTASGATVGSFRVLVRNRAGTTISAAAEVTVKASE